MTSFAQGLNQKKAFHSLKGVSIDTIHEAEEKLGLKFSKEFTEYAMTYGAASFFGHELTGFCSSARLNVVNITLDERQHNPGISQQLYVVEKTNFDGIIVWQDASGTVYETAPGAEAKKVSSSLEEYYSEK